ncbi:Fe-S cluster assembly sulfur transfer protein SufU [Calothrix sp. CCY 0018]|uniref:Fe-S cluster assembly sulfur transfer protein SufU n=1 Tax=Calothrix sp. CCY 0018 TaxID=3103864 RepID=UPI0039C5C94C
MNTNQRQRYQQVILSHARKPQHKGKTNLIHRQNQGENSFCGDKVDLTLMLDETETIIEDIKFEGAGCALCLASADLMAGAVKGKNASEALLMVEDFRKMVIGETEFQAPLEKLNIMQSVAKFPMRVKCVTLAWHTLKGALAGEEKI